MNRVRLRTFPEPVPPTELRRVAGPRGHELRVCDHGAAYLDVEDGMCVCRSCGHVWLQHGPAALAERVTRNRAREVRS